MGTYIDPSILDIMNDTLSVTSSPIYTTGISGQTLSISSGGTGGVIWANTGTNIVGNLSSSSGALNVTGDAKFEGEITMKGIKLSETLAKIEERLAILHPNPKLEDKWDELKELGKRYKELEAEIIEKEKVWAILKR